MNSLLNKIKFIEETVNYEEINFFRVWENEPIKKLNKRLNKNLKAFFYLKNILKIFWFSSLSWILIFVIGCTYKLELMFCLLFSLPFSMVLVIIFSHRQIFEYYYQLLYNIENLKYYIEKYKKKNYLYGGLKEE